MEIVWKCRSLVGVTIWFAGFCGTSCFKKASNVNLTLINKTWRNHATKVEITGTWPDGGKRLQQRAVENKWWHVFCNRLIMCTFVVGAVMSAHSTLHL